MSASEKRHRMRPKPNIKLRLTGIVLICLSLVSLLGFFEMAGAVGRVPAHMFKSFLGRLSWLGPFISFGLGSFLVTQTQEAERGGAKGRRKKRRRRRNRPASEQMPKRQGFREYFSERDPLSERQHKPELFSGQEEGGQNLHNYFASTLNIPGTSSAKIIDLGTGFDHYFNAAEVACTDLMEKTEERPKPPMSLRNRPVQRFTPFVDKPVVKGASEPVSDNRELLEKPELTDTGTGPIAKPHPDPAVEINNPQPGVPATKPEQAPSEQVPPVKRATIRPTATTVREISFPALSLLDPALPPTPRDKTAERNAVKLEQILQNLGINARVTEKFQGPAVTRYLVQPTPEVKIKRILDYTDEIALGLGVGDIRIDPVIAGDSLVGVEVPTQKVHWVKLKEVLESKEFERKSQLNLALGRDVTGNPVVADLSRMPHVLIAGAAGSGKSVCMNSMITSILCTARPDKVKLVLIDLQNSSLTKYNGIPHLVAPVVTDAQLAAAALNWVVNEMETRCELLAAAGVKDITQYNQITTTQAPIPAIVVLIDELSSLMEVVPGDVEEAIYRLAKAAAVTGIHLVLATQHPSVDVITGIIKAHIPARIAFAVSSAIESRAIIDANGAEKLLGEGDMLYHSAGMSRPLRVQGCLLSGSEVEKIVRHWKSQAVSEHSRINFAEYKPNSEQEKAEDQLFAKAARLFITSGIASVPLLQRRLRVSYTRAAKLMELLEQKGVIDGFAGGKPRAVIMSMDQFQEQFGDKL